MKQTNFYFKDFSKLSNHIFYVLLALLLIPISCSKDTDIFKQSDNEEQVEKRQQWRPGNWWTPCEAAGLIMFVDPCFLNPVRADALQALNDAVDAYNNVVGVGINITLVFDATTPNIDITIDCDDTKIETQGENGCVNATGGNFIGVDTDGPGGAGCDFNVCFITNTIMHELGHILGFGHTNVAGDGQLIAGTTVNTNSVFVTGDCNSDICEFSAGDILALQTQYPEVTIEGLENLCLNEVFFFCIKNQDVNRDMEIYWSSNNTIPASVGGLSIKRRIECHEFSFDTPGEYTLTAWIVDGDCTYAVFKTITVHEEEDCDECYCECEIENDIGEIDFIEHEIECDQDCTGPIPTPTGWEINSCEKKQRIRT